MSVIGEIEKQYFEIDKEYSLMEHKARGKGYFKAERKWQRKRELNILAYFLFAFTRLEDHIREQTSQLITDKQNLSTPGETWKKRKAVWDILPKNKTEDGIHFLKRVALLTDKSRQHYEKVKEYYEERNTIGHGGVFTIPIDMVAFFSDMKNLFKVLKK